MEVALSDKNGSIYIASDHEHKSRWERFECNTLWACIPNLFDFNGVDGESTGKRLYLYANRAYNGFISYQFMLIMPVWLYSL